MADLPATQRRSFVAMLDITTRRAWTPPGYGQIAIVIIIAAIGFYVIYPLASIIINSFNVAQPGQPPTFSIDAWVNAWHNRGVIAALGNSFKVAFWYQLLSFPIGVLLAWVLGRTNLPASRWLEFCFWLSFFLPALSTTLGWILILDPHAGLLNQALARVFGIERGPFNIFSFAGIVWTHLVSHAISAKVMLLTPAFRYMDAALEEASQTCGADRWRTLLRVTLPVMTPPLVIVLVLSSIRLFESFEIELLLGAPFNFYVFSTKIVDLARQEPPLLGQGSALGSVTLLILFAAVPIQRWLTTRRSYTTVTGRMRHTAINLGRWRWAVFAIVASVAAILVLVPLFSVVAGSFMTRFGFFNLRQVWTLANWHRTLNDPAFASALFNTFEIAIVAAVVGTLLFSIIAYLLVRAGNLRGRGLLDILLWMPSVVPGVLTGLGLLWMFVDTPVFRPLYGTIWILVFAALMGGMTLSTQMLKTTFLQLSKELEEGARMCGAGWIRTYFRVVLPLVAPTLIVVAALDFMLAASATSSVVLLATSETRTLSLLVLDFVSVGQREAASVVTVVTIGLTTGMALLARGLGLNLSIRSE